MENVNKIIKIADNGTLYVETSEFLKLSSVKDQIARLMDSSVYKNLLDKKTEDQQEKNK